MVGGACAQVNAETHSSLPIGALPRVVSEPSPSPSVRETAILRSLIFESEVCPQRPIGKQCMAEQFPLK